MPHIWEGGCEGVAGKAIAAVLVVVALLVLFYVYTFARDQKLLVFGSTEKMCGGMDQGCHCSGNETFVGGFTAPMV